MKNIWMGFNDRLNHLLLLWFDATGDQSSRLIDDWPSFDYWHIDNHDAVDSNRRCQWFGCDPIDYVHTKRRPLLIDSIKWGSFQYTMMIGLGVMKFQHDLPTPARMVSSIKPCLLVSLCFFIQVNWDVVCLLFLDQVRFFCQYLSDLKPI